MAVKVTRLENGSCIAQPNVGDRVHLILNHGTITPYSMTLNYDDFDTFCNDLREILFECEYKGWVKKSNACPECKQTREKNAQGVLQCMTETCSKRGA